MNIDKIKWNKLKHKGEINLVGVKVPCYVHGDGITRVLSAQGVREVLKKIGAGDIERKSGEKLRQLLNQRTSQIFVYNKEGKSSSIVVGYEAVILEDLFNVCLEATKSKLSPKQKTIAKQCEMLLRTLAKIGIIALVDEVTGYQYEKKKNELYGLQSVLKTYTSSPRAFKLISENKEEFLKHLKEKYSLADSETADEVSKEDFDEALKVLLNTSSRKKK